MRTRLPGVDVFLCWMVQFRFNYDLPSASLCTFIGSIFLIGLLLHNYKETMVVSGSSAIGPDMPSPNAASYIRAP